MKPTPMQLFVAAGVCLLTAVVTWALGSPEASLVGARVPPAQARDYRSLLVANFDATREALAASLVWGVLRNGDPIPPPKPVAIAEEEKPVEWNAVGSAIRKRERVLFIRIENAAPVAIPEGGELPNGATLVKVLPRGYVLKRADGKTETVQLTL